MLGFILSILFPSWRFFSSIGASPRIELGFMMDANHEPIEWFTFRPLPQQVNLVTRVLQLFYNPAWNELLYINTCAEHLFESPSEFYELEIGRRLVHALRAGDITRDEQVSWLVFRIRAIESVAVEKLNQVVFVSRQFPLNIWESE